MKTRTLTFFWFPALLIIMAVVAMIFRGGGNDDGQTTNEIVKSQGGLTVYGETRSGILFTPSQGSGENKVEWKPVVMSITNLQDILPKDWTKSDSLAVSNLLSRREELGSLPSSFKRSDQILLPYGVSLEAEKKVLSLKSRANISLSAQMSAEGSLHDELKDKLGEEKYIQFEARDLANTLSFMDDRTTDANHVRAAEIILRGRKAGSSFEDMKSQLDGQLGSVFVADHEESLKLLARKNNMPRGDLRPAWMKR